MLRAVPGTQEVDLVIVGYFYLHIFSHLNPTMASWEKAVLLAHSVAWGEMTVSRPHSHCLEELRRVLLPVFPGAQGLA